MNLDNNNVSMLTIAFDEWLVQERKKRAAEHENRMKSEAMRRVSTKYKRIHNHSEYVLNSIYTYSFDGLFK